MAGPAPTTLPSHDDPSAGPVHSREPMQSRHRSGRIGDGSLPQEDCMGFDQIIALDLGKFKSVACIMDVATRRHQFATVQSTPAALHEFLVGRAGADASRTLVACEACDCAGWVHDLAAALGFDVRVANTCHESWKWRRVKRKTDRDDAL